METIQHNTEHQQIQTHVGTVHTHHVTPKDRFKTKPNPPNPAHDSSPFIYVKSWRLRVSQSLKQKHLRAKSQRSCKTTEVLLGQCSRSFGNHEECLKIRLAKFLGCTFEFSSEQKSNSLLFNQLGVYTKVGWGFTHVGVVVTVLPICIYMYHIYTLFWLTSTLMVWLNWDNKIMILTFEACSGDWTNGA